MTKETKTAAAEVSKEKLLHITCGDVNCIATTEATVEIPQKL